MIRTVIFGYGNIGSFALDALLESPDFNVLGIIDSQYKGDSVGDIPVVDSIEQLLPIDVAILCTPSRVVPDLAAQLLASAICTVDCYDIHSSIVEVRNRLDKIAKEHGVAAVTAAGWDPGSDSMIRTIFEVLVPKGLTYTNFGPGMSMGHTVAAKAIQGVKDALSMTIPTGAGVHRRMVYVELESNVDFNTVAARIKEDDYFAHDETHVMHVESVNALKDMGHGVQLTRKGVSGKTHNQNLCFEMSINNPALTSQILVGAARAVQKQAPGCYTMIELAPIDLLPGDRDALIKRLV